MSLLSASGALPRRTKVMKSRNTFTNAKNMPKVVFQSGNGEEEKSSGPSPAEIRLRAFEIHMARGGFHGRELDDWLQAERELQEQYKTGKNGATK